MAKPGMYDPVDIRGVALIDAQHGLLALPKPARHGKLFALAAFLGHDMANAQQGFVTVRGQFLTRAQAAAHVRKPNGELYSEDLW